MKARSWSSVRAKASDRAAAAYHEVQPCRFRAVADKPLMEIEDLYDTDWSEVGEACLLA